MVKNSFSRKWIGCRAFGFALLFLPTCKCTSSPTEAVSQPCLQSIEVLPPQSTPGEAFGIEATSLANDLQKRIQQAVAKESVFRISCSDAASDPRAKIRLTLGASIESSASGSDIHLLGHFQVTLAGDATGMEPLGEDTKAVGIVPLTSEADQSRLITKTAMQLTDDLLRSYLDRQHLWTAEPKQLYSALKPDAGESRLEAIQIIGKRQLREAIPTLLVLLEDEDERIRDAALGALLRMKETRTVAVLTRSRAMRDSREMHKVVEAIALLGGPEALSYLAFVAENHDIESIRIAAQKALKRIGKSAQ